MESAYIFDAPAFDKSIVGTTLDGRVIYLYEKMVHELMQDEGMSDAEATEFIDYNTIRALDYTNSAMKPLVVSYYSEYPEELDE